MKLDSEKLPVVLQIFCLGMSAGILLTSAVISEVAYKRGSIDTFNKTTTVTLLPDGTYAITKLEK